MSTVVYTRTRTGPTDPFALSSLIDTAKSWTGTTCVINGLQVSVTNSAQVGTDPTVQSTINAYVFEGRFGLGEFPFIITLNGVAPQTWTNMPAALTEVPGSRAKLPLYMASFGRLTVAVITAGAAGAVLIAQVSLDGSAWTSGPTVPIAAAGLQVATVAIPPQFQTDLFFRLAGQGGDGVADPVFGLVTVQIG